MQVYRKLQYFVPMPGKHKKDESGKKARLELLKGISGAAVPGQLTALMGGSGAGKVRLSASPVLPLLGLMSMSCAFEVSAEDRVQGMLMRLLLFQPIQRFAQFLDTETLSLVSQALRPSKKLSSLFKCSEAGHAHHQRMMSCTAWYLEHARLCGYKSLPSSLKCLWVDHLLI